MRYKSEAFGRLKEYRLEGYALETAAKLLNMAPSKKYLRRHTKYGMAILRPRRYYFYDPSKQKIFVSRNVVFLEKSFPMDNRRDEVLLEESSEPPQQNDMTSFEPSVPTNGVLVLRRSTKESRPLERLVAKGYTQRPGVEFGETYSPVAMTRSIRILLAIAVSYDYEIWQMDVKMAFLNDYVEEEIFMDQLEGFTSVREEQKICRLQRSIYGLKQASRS
ncbi:UNVERIFIED_CONTAM: Retrovirus-related Pol polyprotein from transposon TNT 1-94 [Sesamum calycinum]|uniref:Retrovirus-related Pol polyprotein from transposon TNT 1-94 n=1 Tax=Sesamum calycinum TaxID=2727403 RepID=A0AAW2PAU2_9LAMI